jgi:hypothetical protein
MKTHRIVFLLVMAVASLFAHGYNQGDVSLHKSQGDGKSFDYFIPQGRAEKLPKWEPTQPTIPLSIKDAVARAQVWMKKQNPKIDSFAPRSIELKRVSARGVGLWYYTIAFDGVVGTEQMFSWSLQAVVLMDGSIVEPKLEKQQ